MRWSAIIVLAIGCFGACLGVALQTQQNGKANGNGAGTGGTGDRQELAFHPVVDKQKTLDLTPVRAPAQLGERAYEHVRKLVGFGPRYTGMPGWSQQIDYIVAELKERGVEAKTDSWMDRRELKRFTNVTATIPGKNAERIVLACHHDTKCTTGHDNPEHNFHFVGANDGASAVALLIELAGVLKARDNAATIELVFFDGEESLDWKWNEAARALFGSKRYVAEHRERLLLGEESRIEAMVLLDMVGRTDLHIQEETYSTPRLREIVWSAAVALGLQQNVYRHAEPAADDHEPFLRVGIPSVDLIDLQGNPHWHKPTDTIENMSPKSLQKVADLVLTMLPEIERAYVTERR